MSDSEEEGALQIDIGRASDSVSSGAVRSVGKRPRKGWEPGDIVWAKVTGFNYWPAKVFDAMKDPLVPDWLKPPPRPTYMLVRFFGTYDMQWVSSNSAETYEKGLKKKFHNKSKRKVFLKALREARAFLDDGELSEGMTLRPPDPPEEQNSDTAGSPPVAEQTTSDATDPPNPISSTSQYTCPVSTAPAPQALSGSRRRKGSTPRRLSSTSSSSIHSNETGDLTTETKRAKLDSGVQAFTCAPLPLSTAAQK